MSRISNNTFKVNSDLEQIVEISNTSLPVTITEADVDLVKVGGTAISIGSSASSGCLPVVVASDQTLNVDLDSVAGGAVSLGSKTSANSFPVVIASDQGAVPISTSSTLDVDLDSVNGTTISLGQTTNANSFPVALASDSSLATTNTAITAGSDTTKATVQQNGIYGWDGSNWRQVQVSATGILKSEPQLESHGGSQANMDNATAVVANDTSTAIDVSNKTIISIFGNHSVSSAEIQIQVSADNTNWYNQGFSIFADSNGDFYQLFEGAVNYIRLKYLTAGTVTASAISNAH